MVHFKNAARQGFVCLSKVNRVELKERRHNGSANIHEQYQCFSESDVPCLKMQKIVCNYSFLPNSTPQCIIRVTHADPPQVLHFCDPRLLFRPRFFNFVNLSDYFIISFAPQVFLLCPRFSFLPPRLLFYPRFCLFQILGYYSALGFYSAGKSTFKGVQSSVNKSTLRKL